MRGDFKYYVTMILGEIFVPPVKMFKHFDYQLFSKINIDALWWKDFVSGQSNGNLRILLFSNAREKIWLYAFIRRYFLYKIRELEYYGLQFWKVCAKSPDVNGNCPDNTFIHSTIGFDGQYIMIDFNRNIVVVRNSLYAPILNLSNERKMKLIPSSLDSSNWIVTQAIE